MSKTIDSVLQAIDYMEENLQNELSVLDVSNKACYSVYHFIRLFEGVTGHTPKDYILRRRISEAAKELLSLSSKKIIDICFDYQFGSPEVFSRAFKRILGINPGQLQKGEYFPQDSFLSPIDKDSIISGKNLLEADVELISRDEIKLAGLVTLIRQDKEIISELWNYLGKELFSSGDKDNKSFYGHSYWSNNYDLNGFFLLCGFEVEDLNAYSGGPYCTRTVPAGKYLKFVHQGNVQNISRTYKYIFQTYLPKTDYILSEPYDFEIYYPEDDKYHSENSKTEILLPVK